jgi:RimJ/RimL family protein N-acetyltransferase
MIPMQTPPRTWTTQRLTLRPPVIADADEMFDRYAGDARMTKYLSWRPHRATDETRGFIETTDAWWRAGSVFTWGIWSRQSNEFLGTLAARPENARGHRVQVGYALAPAHWRQGIMSEALGEVLRWLREQPEVFRVWAFCDIDNTASAGLLAHLGMTREGVLRRWNVHPNVGGEPRDCACYAITK